MRTRWEKIGPMLLRRPSLERERGLGGVGGGRCCVHPGDPAVLLGDTGHGSLFEDAGALVCRSTRQRHRRIHRVDLPRPNPQPDVAAEMGGQGGRGAERAHAREGLYKGPADTDSPSFSLSSLAPSPLIYLSLLSLLFSLSETRSLIHTHTHTHTPSYPRFRHSPGRRRRRRTPRGRRRSYRAGTVS